MSIQTANLAAAAEAVPSHSTVHDARLVDRRDHGGRHVLEVVFLPEVDRVPPAAPLSLNQHSGSHSARCWLSPRSSTASDPRIHTTRNPGAAFLITGPNQRGGEPVGVSYRKAEHKTL